VTGGIFLLDEQDQILEMVQEAYVSEDRLQALLATHPSLLAGDQINPTSPRWWLLVAREMSIPSDEDQGGRWSVDHLFLDQDAIPTLVEVKRSSDTRIRREVVGQMLDYAANAVSYWSLEKIQATLQTNCDARGVSPEEMLGTVLGPDDSPDAFWMRVKTNLQAGRLRLVFVADEIPQELRQVVEFLNAQMDPAEVLAVEVKQYVGGGKKSLVPRVVGQSATAQSRRSGGAQARQRWDEARFFDKLEEGHGASAAGTARALLDWAKRNGCEIYWGEGTNMGSFSPRIRHRGRTHQLFVVWTYGRLNIYFDQLQKPPFDVPERRTELIERLNTIDTMSIPTNTTKGYPAVELSVLETETALSTFGSVFEWILSEIRGS
jgi:hypothetical protein